MNHTDTIANLAAALVAAQADLKAVGKDSVNPHFKNRYASLDNIVEAVRPALAKHGLAVIQGTASTLTNDAGGLTGFAVETMLVHKSGEWLSNVAVVPLAKIDAQGAGGALTYGRRYGLSALLSLSTDEDDDGNTASERPQTATASRSRTSAASSTSNGSNHASNGRSADSWKKWPFGERKGTPIGDFETDELRKMLSWCREKGKTDVGEAVANVLAERSLASTPADEAPLPF